MKYINVKENENSNDYINIIIETRGNKINGQQCRIETHHIIPKCLGGTNDKSNLIDLYPEEHYLIHKLLALENKDNKKLVSSWMLMCKWNKFTTPEEYATAKKIASELLSGDDNFFSKKNLDKHHGYTDKAVIILPGIYKGWNEPKIYESVKHFLDDNGFFGEEDNCINLYKG